MTQVPYLVQSDGTFVGVQPTAGATGWMWGSQPPTDAEVERRDSMIREGTLRVLRFTPAHGNDWPLWENGLGPVEPFEFGLSTTLTQELRPWCKRWQVVADAQINETEKLGETPLLDDEWFEMGEGLCRRLAAEVWDGAAVMPGFRSYWSEI